MVKFSSLVLLLFLLSVSQSEHSRSQGRISPYERIYGKKAPPKRGESAYDRLYPKEKTKQTSETLKRSESMYDQLYPKEEKKQTLETQQTLEDQTSGKAEFDVPKISVHTTETSPTPLERNRDNAFQRSSLFAVVIGISLFLILRTAVVLLSVWGWKALVKDSTKDESKEKEEESTMKEEMKEAKEEIKESVQKEVEEEVEEEVEYVEEEIEEIEEIEGEMKEKQEEIKEDSAKDKTIDETEDEESEDEDASKKRLDPKPILVKIKGRRRNANHKKKVKTFGDFSSEELVTESISRGFKILRKVNPTRLDGTSSIQLAQSYFQFANVVATRQRSKVDQQASLRLQDSQSLYLWQQVTALLLVGVWFKVILSYQKELLSNFQYHWMSMLGINVPQPSWTSWIPSWFPSQLGILGDFFWLGQYGFLVTALLVGVWILSLLPQVVRSSVLLLICLHKFWVSAVKLVMHCSIMWSAQFLAFAFLSNHFPKPTPTRDWFKLLIILLSICLAIILGFHSAERDPENPYRHPYSFELWFEDIIRL